MTIKIDCKNNTCLRNRSFGVGMEKLDRDAFDPSRMYDHVAALGVKWVRIQSGWAKTEKEKGKYDFSWLDPIVDELTKRNLSPWICLCYGNPLYDEKATKIVGGLNCPPIGDEKSREGWKKYCVAVAERYKGKVGFYEVWNEPEWLWSGPADPVAYTRFCRETAKAVKEGDPEAEVIVGSVASISPDFLAKCVSEGILENADALSYHAYTYDEGTFARLNRFYTALVSKADRPIKIIHGECGSQSKNGGNGAFKGFPTDPNKQAKQLLRQMVVDRASNIFFSSYFTLTDMHENLMAPAGRPIRKHGYFGLLSAGFDKNGVACPPFTPKPSYYAYQNLCAFLPETARKTEIPFWVERERDVYSPLKHLFQKEKREWTHVCFENEKGKAFLYWMPTDLLYCKKYSASVSIRFLTDEMPRHVDLLSGEVTDLPHQKKDGCILIETLPVSDYPMAVVFGDFVPTCCD